MARVNVFLKEALLEAVDAEAAGSGMSRSALIQAALTSFLESRRKEREEAAIRSEMEEAARGMDVLAEKLGGWDPGKVIREFRDRRSMAVRERGPKYRTPRRKGRRS